MTEKEDFDFPVAEDAAMPGSSAPAGTTDDGRPPAAAGRRPLRLLLLLLLLLVGAGAAGLYFRTGDGEVPPPPAPVKKQPMPLPSPQAAAPVEPAAAPAASATAPAPTAPTPAPGGEAAGGEKVAAAAPPAEPGPPPAAGGRYVLRAGAFLLEANLREAARQVRALGFEPRVTRTRQTVAMTRLRVGVYPPAEAKSRLREVAPLAPDAFLLRDGERLAVYAATYYDLDQARRFADRLYQQGVRVEEEAVKATVPLHLLAFGDFADLAAARAAAARARAAGLAAYVAERR